MHKTTMICLLLALAGSSLLRADDPVDCGLRRWERVTNDYYYSATSAEGAKGDVVAIDISLTIDAFPAPLADCILLGCYDPAVLRPIGEAVFSERFEQATYLRYAFTCTGDVGPVHPDGLYGFSVVANFLAPVQDWIPLGESFPIGTVYFRVVGEPGDSTEIRFCDNEFIDPGGGCAKNSLDFSASGFYLIALSERHVPGVVRVVSGDPEHTLPPVTALPAEVYPQAPTPETTDIAFELSGAVARPASEDVPLNLYVTSSHEFCGYSVSLGFPPDLVEITDVEELTRPGLVAIDKERGSLALLMNDSTRRVGREGERVHLATVHVHVEDAASEVDEISFRFENRGNFINWLGIRYQTGINGEELPVTAEITPIVLKPGILKLQLQGTSPGDVNLDYTRNVSDAVKILGYLFQGKDDLVCPAAADVNADGRVNLTDPIDLLLELFEGASPASSREVFCDEGG